MKLIILTFCLFLSTNLLILGDEYKYSNDPDKFIKQFENNYPDKKLRLKELNSALFEINHYAILYLPSDFIKKTTDYMKLLIDETNQKQFLGNYFYFVADYYTSNLDMDSNKIMMIKANNEFKSTKNYTFLTHSLLVLGHITIKTIMK